jgi:sulfoxide reductase catalytic subunit YedY
LKPETAENMLIKNPSDINENEITPKETYLNRRMFLRGAALTATVATSALLYRKFNPLPLPTESREKIAEIERQQNFSTEEKPNTLKEITNYNNFYEFSTDKSSVAYEAKDFKTKPWQISVEGLTHKPKVFDLDDLIKLFPQEERIYRFRCVEAWSMVIPWVGFPLKALLDKVEPLSNAKYVAFETYYDERQMPNAAYAGIDFPYVEGLRIDEAMHPLTILATGLYGEILPPQNGAPIRLVVPWKYGFKSIKSIVKIKLVEQEPPTTWNIASPDEYGFYSNVNPNVRHPRWSQAKERRIGEFGLRDTLLFNGYANQVAKLYEGMDLRKYF